MARADVPKLAWLGIAGIALVHASYFAAIARIDIGVALVIQYLAPALLLIWLRVVHKRRAAPSLWAAVVLSMLGSALVVDAVGGTADLDALGILAALAGAVTLVIYLVSSEDAGQRYDAFTILFWGFGFATLFWLVVAPVWTFPWELLGSTRNLALAFGVAVIGTLVPFLLLVSALRHLPAARVAVVAMREPVLGAVIAWGVHDQALAATQILGGVIVLVAITWVQTHRPPRSTRSRRDLVNRRPRADRPWPRETARVRGDLGAERLARVPRSFAHDQTANDAPASRE